MPADELFQVIIHGWGSTSKQPELRTGFSCQLCQAWPTAGTQHIPASLWAAAFAGPAVSEIVLVSLEK